MSFTRNTVLTALFALTTVVATVEPANAFGGGCGSGSRGYSSFHRPSYHRNYSPVRHYSRPSYNQIRPVTVQRPVVQQPVVQQPAQQPIVGQPVQPVAQQPIVPVSQPSVQRQPAQAGVQPQLGVQQQPVQPQQVAPVTQPVPASPNAAQSALRALGGFAPPASNPQVPAVEPAGQPLAGNWTAAVGNGSTVTLSLENDGRFRWVATNAAGQSSSFEGTYNINNGSLSLLRSNDSQQLSGSMTVNGSNAFTFKVAGNNAAALNFQRS